MSSRWADSVEVACGACRALPCCALLTARLVERCAHPAAARVVRRS
jgi:hypothetical protein